MGNRFDAKTGKWIDTVTGKVIAGPGVGSTPGGTTDVNALARQQADAYGVTLALVNMFPELNKAWDYYLKEDYGKFKQEILNSSFYKNNNATARDRLTAKAEQPGVYEQSYQNYFESTKDRLIQNGVKLDDVTLAQIARTAYDSGMSENQVDMLALKHNKGPLGGSTLGTISELKNYAEAFGVDYNNAFWEETSTSIFAGDTTAEDIKGQIRELSASAFPAYADGIMAGKSVYNQASSKINAMARLHEIDANSISPTKTAALRKALQYVDPTTGKSAQMPDWMWEEQLRKMDAWNYTNNGRDTVDGLATTVIRDFIGGV
jgi:hypothetical protein